mgnify:CR=1 FL=1
MAVATATAEPLLDRFGRPLHVVEGLVIRGIHRALPEDLRPAIDGVRAETLRLLPAFWEEQSETVPVARSQPIRISGATQDATVRTQDEERGPGNGGWPTLPFVVVLVVAVGAATWWWWFRAA